MGRSATGLGTCSTQRRKFAHVEHDVISIANTRAKNKALSDLIRLGELRAEEIDGSSIIIEEPHPEVVVKPVEHGSLSTDRQDEPSKSLCRDFASVNTKGGCI
jgi:hypothetical protein